MITTGLLFLLLCGAGGVIYGS
jgi:hypothetical protein